MMPEPGTVARKSHRNGAITAHKYYMLIAPTGEDHTKWHAYNAIEDKTGIVDLKEDGMTISAGPAGPWHRINFSANEPPPANS